MKNFVWLVILYVYSGTVSNLDLHSLARQFCLNVVDCNWQLPIGYCIVIIGTNFESEVDYSLWAPENRGVTGKNCILCRDVTPAVKC